MLLVLLPAFHGCTGLDPLNDSENSDQITFRPSVVSTRTLLDADSLSKAGSKIRVYDYLTGYTGDIGSNTGIVPADTTRYFADYVYYDGSTIWPYTSGSTYRWTRAGTHMFFGFLTQDKDNQKAFCENYVEGVLFGSTSVASAFNESTRVLSLPVTTTDGDPARQFDFCYSTVNPVPAATHVTGDPVPLQLNHLFSALKLSVKNISDYEVLIDSVKLTGFKNTRSASIDFKTTTPTITYGNISSSDFDLFVPDEGDGPADFAVADEVVPLTDYVMIWPQTYSDLTGVTLDVHYRVIVAGDPSDPLTARINLPSQSMFQTTGKGFDAGIKYTVTLQFMKSVISLSVTCLPWDYEEHVWSYADHSISARAGTYDDGLLWFYRKDNNGDPTVEPTQDERSTKVQRFHTINEVLIGKFYIEAPTSGRWQVTPYPAEAAQYFHVSPTSGEIDVHHNDGLVSFTVSLNTDLTPPSDQTLHFSISLYFNGEWFDANSELNRKDVKVVRGTI